MRTFVLLSTLAVLASARPDAGYSYNRPAGPAFGQGGSGINSGFHGSNSLNGGFNNGFHSSSSSSGGFGSGGFGSGGSLGPSGPLAGPTGPLGGSLNGGGGSFHGSGFQQNTGLGSFQTGGFQTGGLQSGGFQSGGFQTGGFQNGGGSFHQGGFHSGGFNQGGFTGNQPALIQKHIYVHVPPPDPEETRAPHIHGQFGPPQKHYKIIFIKAPSGPQYGSASLPLPPQNEEKTLVYVLVKKPEDASDIYLNNAPTTPPSKPEVYFIKYKTQKDRQNIGGGLVGDAGNVIGGPGPVLSGGSSGTLVSGGGGSIGGSLGGSSIGTSSLGSGSLSGGPAPQYGPPAQQRPF